MSGLSLTQKYAISRIKKTDGNVFVTGPAGSGKSYVLDSIKKMGFKYVVLAPTGVAAANAAGVTIQSFFNIKGEANLKAHKSYSIKTEVDLIVVDEVSMVSNDLFAIMDIVLRKVMKVDKPMGGIRLVVMGDFYQLPPTTSSGTETPIYESSLWKELSFEVCYLHYIFRNPNKEQCKLLAKMRKGIEDDEVVTLMSIKNISKEEASNAKYDDYVHLFWDNKQAHVYNTNRLSKLNAKSKIYLSNISHENYGNIQAKLELKVGARVMCIKNIYSLNTVNGQCGYVTSMDDDSVTAAMDDGRTIKFEYETWLSQEKPVISQIPLKLAWALTINKSQGMTMDKVIVYLRKDMRYGQAYVGISRVKNLDNLQVVDYQANSGVFRCLNVPF